MKKIIAILLGVIIAVSCTACASKTEASEINCPGFIGLKHLDKLKEMNELYVAGELDSEYEITAVQVENYWIISLEGEVDDVAYAAGGIYDHSPSKDDIDILWTNRVPYDQFCSLLEGLGF